jgi:hypothetical protein
MPTERIPMSTTKRSVRILASAAVLALGLAACGGESAFPDESLTIVANSDIGVGTSRLQVGAVSPDGERLGGPDIPVSFVIEPSDGGVDRATYPAEWIWLIPERVGLYRADVELPTAGVWGVAVMPEDGAALTPAAFQVREETFAPNIGEPAPTAPIDTLATMPLEALTTDSEPDEDFYQMTLEEAFGSGSQTVVVFSTPAFCRTATCGPTLDIVKQAKTNFPDVNFIHVEVYTDINAPGFTPTPEFLHPALGPEYWNLPTEPWVFVVDEKGIITARFEGALTPDDVANALS